MVVAIPPRNRSREHVAVGSSQVQAPSTDREELVITENESCSHVVRPDGPARENHVMCSMQAAVVCTKGCKGVRVSAQNLEAHLHLLLVGIQPQAHLLAKMPTIAARSSESRKERVGADAKSLVRRLDDQQTFDRQTIEARVRGTLNDSDFRVMKASIDSEIERIEAQIKSLDSERCTMEELVRPTEREVINFGKSGRVKAPASLSPAMEVDLA
jgi:hypothetical protein